MNRREKLTGAQRQKLERLAQIGAEYGSGPVCGALVRKGLAKFFGHGAGIELTDAGRSLLQKQGPKPDGVSDGE